jgi:hypothetical protein
MLKRCSVLALMHLVVAADSLAHGTNGTAAATATQGLSAGCGALPRPACKHREVLECANTYLDCELIDSESEEEMAVQWTGDDGDQGAGAPRRCESLPACLDGYLSCMGACVRGRLEGPHALGVVLVTASLFQAAPAAVPH